MTLRLYRPDSFLWTFHARVLERVQHDGQPALILDQTAFYPTAGGQPNDLGTLNGVPVTDVVERDDGTIVHVLAAPLQDAEVIGEVDAPRRIDHMQQHSGQHVLSQAFVHVADLDTISVHIGSGDCTLDLPAPRLAPEIVQQAEEEANRVLFDDRPFIVQEMTDAQVAQLPLRKAPAVTGQIRIVEVQDYDWSACGGTHVRSSAQIGLIKVTRFEKRGDTTRVYFRCGRRALADYGELSALALKLSETFSMGPADLLPAIDKLREESRATRKALADAQARLMEYETQELLREITPADGTGRCVIARTYEGRDANALKMMGKRLTSEPGVIALLGGYSAGRAFLCFARSRDAQADMAALLRGALQTLNARGGGSPEFAQGSGEAPNVAAAQTAVDWAIGQLGL